MFFFNIEACTSILVDPKNKMINIENEHNRSFLNKDLKGSRHPLHCKQSAMCSISRKQYAKETQEGKV